MIQDDVERQDKLFKMIQKISKNIEAQKAERISEIGKPKLKVEKRKNVQKQCSDLPYEIWLKILNFMNSKDIFTNFARVSKNFHILTLDPSSVRVLDLVKINTKEKYQKAMKVLKRSNKLHGVTIKCPQLYSNNFIVQAFKSNPNLKSLDIFEYDERWIELQKDTIKAFGKGLNKLNLEGVYYIELKDELVNIILEQENLSHLQISMSSESVVKVLLSLLPQKCKKLEYILFKEIWENYSRTIQDSFDQFFDDMKDTLKGVKFGLLHFIYLRPKLYKILKNIALCQKLEYLEIFDASCLKAETFHQISKLPNLKKLNLHQVGPAAKSLTKFLNTDMINLEEIYIQGSEFVTNKFLEVLVSRLPPKVNKMSFTGCLNLKVSESSLKDLMKCPSLKTLGFEEENLKYIPKDTLLEFNKTVNIKLYQCLYPGWKWITLTQYYNHDY